jgi:hypothetical protein
MGLVRLSVLACVVAGALAAPAAAAPPTELQVVSERVGEVRLLSAPRTAGRTTHVEFEEDVELTGGLQSTELSVLRLQCTIVGTARMSCHGEQRFTGTVDGIAAAGTSTSAVRFTCSLPEQRCTGSTTVVDGTGGLAGVSGRSTFVGNPTTGSSVATMWIVRH